MGHYDVIDTLNAPQHVVAVSEDGLLVANGSLVRLIGVSQVPHDSEVLQAMIERGVEVDRHDGRVYGLLSVWPRCGMNPVRVRITRVDIAHVLEFVADTSDEGGARKADATNGWSEATYGWYERWLERRHIESAAQRCRRL